MTFGGGELHRAVGMWEEAGRQRCSGGKSRMR
jgi:hypothetical protein